MRIDVHTHYNPPSYFELLRELGAFEELSALKLMGHLWRPGHAMAQMATGPDGAARRIADMDEASIDAQVMSVAGIHPYLRDPDTSTTLARHVNDEYKQMVDYGDGRFAALGTIPLPHIDEALAELNRCIDELGFPGIALGCSAAGRPLDDELFAPVWQALDDKRLSVYLHPGVEITGVVGCDNYHLAADFVSPAEIAVTACRMIASGHLDRYPNVTIILATLGGTIPFLARRFDRGLRQDCPDRWEELGGVEKHLKRFYADTSVIEEPNAVRAAIDTFGIDKILLGTDYGRPGVRSQNGVDYVNSANGLSAGERTAILDENAAGLRARIKQEQAARG